MPGLTLDPRATLLVVDVQALTLPNARAVPADALVERIGRLVDRFRASGRAVAYAVSSGTRGRPSAPWSEARDWPGPALAIPPAVRPQPGDRTYVRTGWSAFAGTALEVDLRERGSRQLVVVGIATSFGVESTVRAAYDLGLGVVVPTDAVSDPDPGAQVHTVEHVLPLLAVTVSTDALLDLLAPSA